MKATDINELKGNVKSAIQAWSESKIDNLFPGKPKTRVLLKNGLENLMLKYDSDLNKMIDGGIVLVGKNDAVDTDSAVELLVGVFEEMDIKEYNLGIIPISVGKGEIVAELPHNPLLDIVVGNLGKVKITSADLLELKELLNV